MSMMSRDITDLKAVELRERKNMAGGLSTFEKQAALTDPFTNIHERIALEGGGQGRSSGPSLGGLSMPPPPPLSPSLPGVLPNEAAMYGAGLLSRPQGLGASGPIAHGQPVRIPDAPGLGENFKPTGFQQLSLPSAPGGGGGSAFQSGGDLTSFHGAGGGDMFSGIGRSSSPLSAQSSQGQSNAFENIASTLGEVSPGNLWNDVKRGVNPLLQFGKEMVKLVAGSVIAFVNFFFKPNTTK